MSRNHAPRILAGIRAFAAAAACSLSLVCGVHGDRVHLTNGQVLEGIIEEESDASIVLNVGMGALSVRHERIDRIEREGEAENASTRALWKATYIQARDLPESLRVLAAAWDRLEQYRAEAKRGVRTLGRLDRETVRIERDLNHRQKQYLATNRRLNLMTPEDDRKAYNEVVTENNRLVGDVNQLQANIRANELKRDAAHKAMSKYARALTTFEIAYEQSAAAFADRGPEEIETLWLQRLGDDLTVFSQDFTQMKVPVENTPGGRVAQVKLNDDLTGSFLVDTGASLVTLSETMAKRLRLRYDPEATIPVRLADGETTEGIPISLGSVQVGDARVENVGAVVMPNPPGPGLDGLLGMTFLSRFQLSFIGEDGEIVLRKLKAD